MRRFGDLSRLPIPDRDKINLELPSFTLDVNQIALRAPSQRRPELTGLAFLEYHYFEEGSVELCVTPETTLEILHGIPVNLLGRTAYDRIQKTKLFKSRPASTTLNLTHEESDELWTDIRSLLWPNLTDSALTSGHIADVNQIFFHTVCSSTIVNAAFVTLDNDILRHSNDLKKRYGINVVNPNDAWQHSYQAYGLVEPASSSVNRIFSEQEALFKRLREASK